MQKHSASRNRSGPSHCGHKAGATKRLERKVVIERLQWLSRECMNYVPVNWPVKLLMTAAATWLLSRAVIGSAEVKMAEQDIIVYSSIYCGWAIFFLPDILLHVSGYILGKLFWLFLRLFLPELIVCVFLHFFKGDNNVWLRGLSLRPMMSPEYQWMEETVHSIRFMLIVGCLSASVVANLFDRPEILIDYVESGDEDDDMRRNS